MTIADQAIEYAARVMGATPADIPGLWNVPGHPELTTGQLLDLFGRMAQNVPLYHVGDSPAAVDGV